MTRDHALLTLGGALEAAERMAAALVSEPLPAGIRRDVAEWAAFTIALQARVLAALEEGGGAAVVAPVPSPTRPGGAAIPVEGQTACRTAT